MTDRVQYALLVVVATGKSYGNDVEQISVILPDGLEIIRYSADFDQKSGEWKPRYFNSRGESATFPANMNYTLTLLNELGEEGWRQVGSPTISHVNIHGIMLLHPGWQADKVIETHTLMRVND